MKSPSGFLRFPSLFLLLALLPSGWSAGDTQSPPPPRLPLAVDGASLFDLDSYDTNHWDKADSWCNPPGFDACWRADHITHDQSIMTIALDDTACSGDCSDRSFASGEYRTYDPGGSGNEYYGYGCFEARFKAVAGSGLITSFFTYNGGPWDTPPGGNGLHNDIDIEILGRDTTKMQANFFANGVGNHEQLVPLGFDSALDFHNYTIKWIETGIEWYVDGALVNDWPREALTCLKVHQLQPVKPDGDFWIFGALCNIVANEEDQAAVQEGIHVGKRLVTGNIPADAKRSVEYRLQHLEAQRLR